jgi:hypothetical protein
LLENRHLPTIVAGVAIVIAIIGWVRAEAIANDLEETRQATAGLAVQAAVVDSLVTGLSDSLGEQLQPVIASLDDFAASRIAVPIDIDQELPIDTEISFVRTIEVPIRADIPINEEIDTTITIQGPFDTEIDVDVTVPVAVVVPVDLTVPIEINETIPVKTTVPIVLSFPIEFDVAGTPLADLAIALRSGLADLAGAFG